MGVNRIKQFADIAKQDGLPEAVSRALSFFGTRAVRSLAARSQCNNPITLDNASNILFIEASNDIDGWGLGDGIFRIPTIEALTHTTGNTVDILTTEKRMPIFQNNPHIGNIIAVQESFFDTVNHIRENQYTHIFTLNPGWKMILLMILAGDINAVRRVGFIPLETMAQENHIDMYIENLRTLVQNLIVPNNTPRIYWEVNKTLPEGYFYIGINIGANSALRNFKEWSGVFNQMQESIPENVKFVLVGNSQIQGVNTELSSILGDSAIDLTTNLTLQDTYNVISQCHAFIGADGGNVNAALSIIQKNVFPIYSVVAGGKRLPSDFPENAIIQGTCPIYETGCFEHTFARECEVTGQSELDHSIMPPCISGSEILNKLAFQITGLFHQAEALIGSQ